MSRIALNSIKILLIIILLFIIISGCNNDGSINFGRKLSTNLKIEINKESYYVYFEELMPIDSIKAEIILSPKGSYKEIKNKIKKKRIELSIKYTNAKTISSKKEIIDKSKDYLKNVIVNELISTITKVFRHFFLYNWLLIAIYKNA